MSEHHQHGMSRRSFLSANATLLASFGLSAVFPMTNTQARPVAGGQSTSDLALYRPVAVSSTDYAPTPAEFAVDRLSSIGVRGSGWRAKPGDPQWIMVDLQAQCTIESVVLVFEAQRSDPPFVPPTGSGNPRNHYRGRDPVQRRRGVPDRGVQRRHDVA